MRRLKKSFTYAAHGIVYALKNEKNFQIESLVAGAVLGLAFLMGFSTLEWGILFLVCASVLGMELINTAFERVIDMLKPRVHPFARVVKDLMAGAVLLVSATAVIIGALLFLPHLIMVL